MTSVEPSGGTSCAVEPLVIAPVTGATRDAVFAYHRANLGQFLLPLTPSTFQEIVEARQMVALERGGEIAGLCYVKPDGKDLDDVARWEFGGLYLAPASRGLGLGVALSTVAIAVVTHASPKPVMAYVHRANHDALSVLVHRLGFVVTAQTIRLGPDDAPGYLRRDSAGFATAHVLRLPAAALTRIADEVERLGDNSSYRDPRISPRLAEGLFPSGLHEAARHLREAAQSAVTTAETDLPLN